jgi:hypothetical protein
MDYFKDAKKIEEVVSKRIEDLEAQYIKQIKFLQEQLKIAQEKIKMREQELNMILGANYQTVNLIESLLAKGTKRVVSGQPLVGNYKGDTSAIRIMSWNVLARGATTHQQEKHGFTFKNTYEEHMEYKQSEHIEQTLARYLLIKDEIIQNNPDIVLLQEVDNYFFTYILKNLPEYTGYFKLIIPSRGDFSSNFATAIIWKSQMFTMNEQKTLDSKSYRALHQDETLHFTEADEAKLFNRKNATYVRLTEIGTQSIISLVSIHLSGDDSKRNFLTNAKENLLTFALEFLNKNESDYRVLGGDMNCPMLIRAIESGCAPEEKCCDVGIKNLLNKSGFNQITQNGTISTCDFDYASDEPIEGKRVLIDSMFHTRNLRASNYLVQTLDCDNPSVYEKHDDLYGRIIKASDHAWISCDYRLVT